MSNHLPPYFFGLPLPLCVAPKTNLSHLLTGASVLLLCTFTSSQSPETLIFPSMGFTENGSATFMSTGNSRLDFFFHVVPDTPPQKLLQRLELSWKCDALTTLKFICNLRGVRGTGKSEKEGFYTAALWLHNNHPKTLACNIKAIADFGYFKDVLEILYRLLEGHGVRKNENEEWMKKKREGFLEGLKEKKGSSIPNGKAKRIREKTLAKANKFLDRYTEDYDFRFLYDKVSGFFADALREDMELYNEGKFYELSLAAKWCPSLDSSYDKSLLMCESVGRKLFPHDEYMAMKICDEYMAMLEVLVPLYKCGDEYQKLVVFD